MKIINKTPHPVVIVDGPTFPACPKDELIRLASTTVPAESIEGIPTSQTVFGEPEGLPPAIPGTFFIVSQIVRSACPDRDDLLVPAEVVRDDTGTIVGCRSLGR